jgi:hypothetical protein
LGMTKHDFRTEGEWLAWQEKSRKKFSRWFGRLCVVAALYFGYSATNHNGQTFDELYFIGRMIGAAFVIGVLLLVVNEKEFVS